ncbi:hypothetical protein D4764_04G0001780 [Takifugu flavidus]|uniref:Uncharacterized protein n=1 Tax=Takifugu flavidus TaxID=433684 RepID=A0A5C6N5E3_9TELE|nr:hypothetical protein D4764_04G0001780 [Takifugu flavidus]
MSSGPVRDEVKQRGQSDAMATCAPQRRTFLWGPLGPRRNLGHESNYGFHVYGPRSHVIPEKVVEEFEQHYERYQNINAHKQGPTHRPCCSVNGEGGDPGGGPRTPHLAHLPAHPCQPE